MKKMYLVVRRLIERDFLIKIHSSMQYPSKSQHQQNKGWKKWGTLTTTAQNRTHFALIEHLSVPYD